MSIFNFCLLSLSCAVAVSSEDPACPGGVCPGLGNLFYLPGVNTKKILTGGRAFLNDKSVGTCAKISEVSSASRKFFEQSSMESLVKSVNTDSSLSGSYSTLSMTAKGSVSVLTGSTVEETSNFHSTQLDVTVITRVADLMQTSECLGSESNFDADYLDRFKALPMIVAPYYSESNSWAPYVSFLEDQGSHMMIQQSLGSRFQEWQSTTSSSSDAAEILKIKACASVEGVEVSGGWSVEACSAYSSSQKTSALTSSSQSLQLIVGGTSEARLGLTMEMSEENLDSFIASADQSDNAVSFSFKPVWETLKTFYNGRCVEEGGMGDPECDNLQRAYNLQAAYEGWLAVGCPKLETSNGHVYQEFSFHPTTDHYRVRTYDCKAAKTGCYSDSDCHLGGAGSVCYCYGSSCLDKGDEIEGIDAQRTEVQGSKSGSYNDGVNNACYYKFLAHCDCDNGWSGGLPDRLLYEQGSSDSVQGESEALV